MHLVLLNKENAVTRKIEDEIKITKTDGTKYTEYWERYSHKRVERMVATGEIKEILNVDKNILYYRKGEV